MSMKGSLGRVTGMYLAAAMMANLGSPVGGYERRQKVRMPSSDKKKEALTNQQRVHKVLNEIFDYSHEPNRKNEYEVKGFRINSVNMKNAVKTVRKILGQNGFSVDSCFSDLEAILNN